MKYLFRVYQWLIAAPLILVATIVTLTVVIIGGQFDSNWWGYYPPRLWSRIWCWLLGVKVEVRNRERINKETSYVFVANHQGAFDIFSIYGYIGHNFKWLMRKGLGNIPLIGLACRCAGHIMVDTHSAGGLKQTVADAKRKLDRGVSIVVFPEGRRTDTGLMAPFKAGAFKLATEFGLPVVPLTIDGSYRVMPRSTFNVTPGKIIITIHDPIPPGENGHDSEAVMEASRAAIASVLPEEQGREETESKTHHGTDAQQ